VIINDKEIKNFLIIRQQISIGWFLEMGFHQFSKNSQRYIIFADWISENLKFYQTKRKKTEFHIFQINFLFLFPDFRLQGCFRTTDMQ